MASSPVEWLNPLHHLSQEQYSELWHKLFTTLLHGFWSRILFFSLIFLAFWVGVRQRNPTLAAVLLILSAIVAYGGGLIDWFRFS